jgi:hypothetical protein
MLFFAAVLMLTHAAQAQEIMSQANVLEVTGEAALQKAGAADWMPLEKGMVLTEGDSIKTAEGSEARIEIMGERKTAELTVRESSQFMLKTMKHDTESDAERTLLDMEAGNVLVKAEKLIGESTFEVKTPTSIVGIRGTLFEVNISANPS